MTSVGELRVGLSCVHAIGAHGVVRFVERVLNLMGLVHSRLVLHVAMRLLVAGQLFGINHRKHLGEALTDTCNPLSGVSEWELVPRHELDALAHHVDKVFLTGGARQATQWFFAEHSVLVVVTMTLAHEETVEVLELSLVGLECLLCLVLVSKLLG